MKTKGMLVNEGTGEILPKYRNWDNYVPEQFDKDSEKNFGKSMTVPDMDFSIKDILEKFTRGVELNLERQVGFTDSEDFDDEPLMNSPDVDLTDIDEIQNVISSKSVRKTGKPKKADEGSVADQGSVKEAEGQKPIDKK